MLVDCEGRNLSVLFSLALHETAELCKQALAWWNDAFGARPYQAIFTDVDDSMHAAIAPVPYSENIHHLLFIFRLFNVNVKKETIPLLQAMSSASGLQWEIFRKKLTICQQASTDSQFESL